MITYGSVCSGIEAATVAWHNLGWRAAWYSEIETFPSQILSHHYPSIPNLGDMTKIYDKEPFKETNIDLLVGGTPCQSFSLAGKRAGLNDPRGDLALEFLRIANTKKPKWIVWENVAGVLSSNKGRDFGAYLRSIQECGYGFAYRVLNARYFGIPQSRRRIFVVGYLGDWRPAAEVLFNEQNCKGNSAPTETWQENIKNINRNTTIINSTGRVASTLKAGYYKCYNDNENISNLIVDKNGIRRLLPIEFERLMGFPDNYTNIPKAIDSKRYKALGNSMVVPVMTWIGSRINSFESNK